MPLINIQGDYMHYHIVLGLLGSGQGSLSKELRDVLVEKNQNSESVSRFFWGSWDAWQLESSSLWPISRVIARGQQLFDANPSLADLVITGPWALDYINKYAQFPGPVTIYWVDRVLHSECRTKSLNYWNTAVSAKTRATQQEYIHWLDQQESLWEQTIASRSLTWSTWRTFIWDQDLEEIQVLPAQSQLSYLKKVAIDHFK